MNRTPRSPAWWALGLLLVAGVVGWLVFAPAAPQQPNEPRPLTVEEFEQLQQDLRRERDEERRRQPIEAQSGGELVKGQWWFGYTPDPQATAAFLRSLAKPTIGQAGPDLLRRATDDKPVLLYRALYEAYAAHNGGAEWKVGAQGIGDCVSWGWAHGADVHLAVRWKLGETSEWKAAATEAIYGGSRVEARCGDDDCKGGWGDGSYGGAAAKWCETWGVVFRQPYSGFSFDLTKYDRNRAKQWGNYGCGGQGDTGKLDAIAKQHPLDVALVRSFDEAAAAIAAGYPVPVCSGRGFSSKRDDQGFCRPSGSWSHCMCFIGVRYDRKGLLCLNSWGPSWVSGPKWPEDQPDGSFWVDADVATKMLQGGDSFAISGYHGFPWRDLKHGDWVRVEPVKPGSLERQLVHDLREERGTFAFSLAP